MLANLNKVNFFTQYHLLNSDSQVLNVMFVH
jgi:hypothetical protein